jgi:hypothetical protein
MNKFTLLFAFLSSITICKAQPVYSWAKYATNTIQYGQLWTRASAVDAAGNMFTTGYFSGSVDFNPGSGNALVTATGDYDIFVAKWDAAGNFTWAKNIGGMKEERSNGIGVDAAGNVYISGFFYDTVDFDPGSGVYKLAVTSTVFQDRDVFILKLDTDGNFIWAKNFAGSYSLGNALAVDAAGNVYTTGSFSGTHDFDPGPGTAELTAPSGASFISKLDKDGNYVWAKSFNGGVGGLLIAVDAAGNVHTIGTFRGTVDFDPGPGIHELTSVTINDGYIAKLNANGDFVWAKQLGNYDLQMPQGLAVDASGNIYNTGYLNGTIDFDPGTGTAEITSAGGYDAYIVKLDANGEYVWAKTMGSPGSEFGRMLSLDAAGNIYFTGGFEQTVDLDPGTGIHNVTTEGRGDIFIVKLNSSGNYIWATTIGNSSHNYCEAISVTGIDNIYLVGAFMGSLDIYPGPGELYLHGSYSNANFFALHLSSSAAAPLPLTLLHFDAVDNGTNVRLQWQTTDEQNIDVFSIERSADGQTYETIGSAAPGNNSKLKNDYTFTDLQPLNGTSFYRLKITDRNGPLSHSRIVRVRRQLNVRGLQVFPNPATDVLNAQINTNEAITMKIIDAGGRIWKQQTINFNGNTTFAVDIQALPSGNYYLLMKGKSTQLVKAFLKK